MRVPVPETLLPADQLGTVHFVGIGGAGLPGIARIMLARGISVTGSDAKESRTVEALRGAAAAAAEAAGPGPRLDGRGSGAGGGRVCRDWHEGSPVVGRPGNRAGLT